MPLRAKLWFSLLIPSLSVSNVAVKLYKCCPDGFQLNSFYECEESTPGLMEQLKKNPKYKEIDFEIVRYLKPQCEVIEHHTINQDNLLEIDGGATSYKYNKNFKREEVCFDTLKSTSLVDSVVFLNCDPCATKLCVNLCCPHGHAFKDAVGELYEKEHRCDVEQEAVKKCQFHDADEFQEITASWIEKTKLPAEKEIAFRASKDLFQCSGLRSLVPAEFLLGSEDMKLGTEGQLQVVLDKDEANDTSQIRFNASEFCLSFTDIPEYDYYYSYDNEENVTMSNTGTGIRPLYSVCYEIEAEKGEEFTGIFYPTALFISCFFILATIIIYLILHDLRSSLFGKLTVAFLCNVFICYLFIGIQHCLDLRIHKDYLGTPFCRILGYIVQHTFIAFFFWTNAMAINIVQKFSNILVSTDASNEKRFLLLNTAYAQGFPFLITLITALMDNYASCSYILPNMGRYSCFLGSEFNPNALFIELPEFLYFYLIIIIIMIINIFCFIFMGYFLFTHWHNVRNIQTSGNNSAQMNILIVIKLFFIMGIPWTLDVISAAVTHNYGTGKTFEVRVALDVLNLLTGLVIFIVLICKKSVLSKLMNCYRNSDQQSMSSTMKTQESMNLRKMSTVSGISGVSTLSAESMD